MPDYLAPSDDDEWIPPHYNDWGEFGESHLLYEDTDDDL